MDYIMIFIHDLNKKFKIQYVQKMNVLNALKIVKESSIDNVLEYDIKYFGRIDSQYAGFQVVMFDGVYDKYKGQEAYWKLTINQIDVNKGLEKLTILPNDYLEFYFTLYQPHTVNAMLYLKHDEYKHLDD